MSTTWSSPDPLTDESLASSPRRRSPNPYSNARTPAPPARKSIHLRGSSPAKQTFELDVGDAISPKRIRVTVEAEPEHHTTYPHQRPDSSSSGGRLSPSPYYSTPYKRPAMKVRTTTVPLRGLSDSEDDAPVATPKRARGRPRKSIGTPIPSKAKRTSTPAAAAKAGTKTRRLSDLLGGSSGDNSEEWDFNVPQNVTINRGRAQSQGRTPVAAPYSATPAQFERASSEVPMSSRANKRGRAAMQDGTPSAFGQSFKKARIGQSRLGRLDYDMQPRRSEELRRSSESIVEPDADEDMGFGPFSPSEKQNSSRPSTGESGGARDWGSSPPSVGGAGPYPVIAPMQRERNERQQSIGYQEFSFAQHDAEDYGQSSSIASTGAPTITHSTTTPISPPGTETSDPSIHHHLDQDDPQPQYSPDRSTARMSAQISQKDESSMQQSYEEESQLAAREPSQSHQRGESQQEVYYDQDSHSSPEPESNHVVDEVVSQPQRSSSHSIARPPTQSPEREASPMQLYHDQDSHSESPELEDDVVVEEFQPQPEESPVHSVKWSSNPASRRESPLEQQYYDQDAHSSSPEPQVDDVDESSLQPPQSPPHLAARLVSRVHEVEDSLQQQSYEESIGEVENPFQPRHSLRNSPPPLLTKSPAKKHSPEKQYHDQQVEVENPFQPHHSLRNSPPPLPTQDRDAKSQEAQLHQSIEEVENPFQPRHSLRNSPPPLPTQLSQRGHLRSQDLPDVQFDQSIEEVENPFQPSHSLRNSPPPSPPQLQEIHSFEEQYQQNQDAPETQVDQSIEDVANPFQPRHSLRNSPIRMPTQTPQRENALQKQYSDQDAPETRLDQSVAEVENPFQPRHSLRNSPLPSLPTQSPQGEEHSPQQHADQDLNSTSPAPTSAQPSSPHSRHSQDLPFPSVSPARQQDHSQHALPFPQPQSDAEDGEDDAFEEFDTIIENEGFTMITAETVPSLLQYFTSPLDPEELKEIRREIEDEEVKMREEEEREEREHEMAQRRMRRSGFEDIVHERERLTERGGALGGGTEADVEYEVEEMEWSFTKASTDANLGDDSSEVVEEQSKGFADSERKPLASMSQNIAHKMAETIERSMSREVEPEVQRFQRKKDKELRQPRRSPLMDVEPVVQDSASKMDLTGILYPSLQKAASRSPSPPIETQLVPQKSISRDARVEVQEGKQSQDKILWTRDKDVQKTVPLSAPVQVVHRVTTRSASRDPQPIIEAEIEEQAEDEEIDWMTVWRSPVKEPVARKSASKMELPGILYSAASPSPSVRSESEARRSLSPAVVAEEKEMPEDEDEDGLSWMRRSRIEYPLLPNAEEEVMAHVEERSVPPSTSVAEASEPRSEDDKGGHEIDYREVKRTALGYPVLQKAASEEVVDDAASESASPTPSIDSQSESESEDEDDQQPTQTSDESEEEEQAAQRPSTARQSQITKPAPQEPIPEHSELTGIFPLRVSASPSPSVASQSEFESASEVSGSDEEQPIPSNDDESDESAPEAELAESKEDFAVKDEFPFSRFSDSENEIVASTPMPPRGFRPAREGRPVIRGPIRTALLSGRIPELAPPSLAPPSRVAAHDIREQGEIQDEVDESGEEDEESESEGESEQENEEDEEEAMQDIRRTTISISHPSDRATHLAPERQSQHDRREVVSVSSSADSASEDEDEDSHHEAEQSEGESENSSDIEMEEDPRIIEEEARQTRRSTSSNPYSSFRPPKSPLKSSLKTRLPPGSPKKAVVFSATTAVSPDSSFGVEEESGEDDAEGDGEMEMEEDDGEEDEEISVLMAQKRLLRELEEEHVERSREISPTASIEMDHDEESDQELRSPSVSPTPSIEEVGNDEEMNIDNESKSQSASSSPTPSIRSSSMDVDEQSAASPTPPPPALRLRKMTPYDWSKPHWKSLLRIKNTFQTLGLPPIPAATADSPFVAETIWGKEQDGSMDLVVEEWMVHVAEVFIAEMAAAEGATPGAPAEGEDWSDELEHVIKRVYGLVSVERKCEREGKRAPWEVVNTAFQPVRRRRVERLDSGGRWVEVKGERKGFFGLGMGWL